MYWGVIYLTFKISRYLLILQRTEGKEDFDKWEKRLWYIYTSVAIGGISFLIQAVFHLQNDSYDWGLLSLLLIPALFGVNSAYKVSYEDCLNRKYESERHRTDSNEM